MISPRLKQIFLISIPVFVAHGLEEYFTGFYATDSHAQFAFGFFDALPAPQAVFLIFQIMSWLILMVSYLLLLGGRWPLRLMVIPGIILVYELYHVYKALAVGGYYPGLITALIFPVIAFFFWKELIRTWRHG